MQKLKLYNSLTKKLEIFKPIKKKLVTFYACGPTVYQAAHIGNLRTYLFEDILKRVLEYNDYKVKHVVNITDVGHLTSDADTGLDKVEEAAKSQKKTAKEITKHYADLFKQDSKALNILPPDKFAWASKYVKQQIKLIEALEKQGYTYATADGIYFDTTKFKNYGKLGKASTGKSRVLHCAGKHRDTDFALWKFSLPDENRQQEWASPWGKGYPGWHVECSAISAAELGQPFDIHAGGEDHLSIHHNNEIAQSEAAYGKPLANYWLHGAFMLMGKDKMSKSKGNFLTLKDLEDLGFEPLAFRYLAITSHYRSKLNFSEAAMKGAYRSLAKLRAVFSQKTSGGKVVKGYKDKFIKAINDDLNMPKAFALIWELVKSQKVKLADKQATLKDFDQVLGLDLGKDTTPKTILDLAKQRQKAKEDKDFDKADKLRDKIEKAGWQVEDTAQGPRLRQKI